MKKFSMLLLLSVAFCLSAMPAKAQDVSGSTYVFTDTNAQTVTAMCETDLDDYAQAYYGARVVCTLQDDSGNTVATGQYFDRNGDLGYAEVELVVTGIPGTTYTAYGAHSAEAVLQDFDLQSHPYIDYYNFAFFANLFQYYPVTHDFYGPGPEQERMASSLSVGGTDDNMPYGSITISPVQPIQDGKTATFSVNVLGGTPSSYLWSFTSPNGAGNNPHVSFTAAMAATTMTDGHWFALPDQPCASGGPSDPYYSSPYGINVKITFSSKQLNESSTLTVTNMPEAGETTRPNVTGQPTLGFNSAQQQYVVLNSGSLQRTQPILTMYLPTSSQFYSKMLNHEQRHVFQYTQGLLSDLYQVASLMQQIQGLTSTISQADLYSKVQSQALTWRDNQDSIYTGRFNSAERDAYNVSDPLTPQYVYQNCGRY